MTCKKLIREVIIKPGGTFFNRSKQYVTYAEFVTIAQNIECRRKCLHLTQAYKTTSTQNQTLDLQSSNKLKELLTIFHPMNKSMTFLVAKNIEHLCVHPNITPQYIKSLNSVVSQMQPAEKEARLKINRTKTKYMESKKNRTYRVNNILLHEQSYKEVSSFKYLGSVVS